MVCNQSSLLLRAQKHTAYKSGTKPINGTTAPNSSIKVTVDKKVYKKSSNSKGNHDRQYNPALFKEVADYKEIHYGKELTVLMHYPLEEWRKSRHGSVHLYGHIHSKHGRYNVKMKEKGVRRYDVGVDTNNYRPVSIEEIMRFMRAEGTYEKKKKLLLSDYGIKSSDNVLAYCLDNFVYYVGLIEAIVFSALSVVTLFVARSLIASSIFLAFTLLGVLLILMYRNIAHFYSSGVILVRSMFGKVVLYNCSDIIKVCHSLNNTTVFHFTDGRKLKFDTTGIGFARGIMKAERLQYEYTSDNVIKVRVSRSDIIVNYIAITFLTVTCLVCRTPGCICLALVLTPVLLMEATTSITYTRDTHVLTTSVLFIKRSYDLTEYTVAPYVCYSTNYLHVCKGTRIVCKIKLGGNMHNTWELCNALGINSKFKSV